MNAKAHLQTIETAFLDSAGDTERRKAATACRQLLAVLEAQPGEKLAQVVALPTPLPCSVPPGVPQPPPAAAQPQVNPTLLLDALIARLKAELPTEEQPETPERKALDIPFVPIPSGQE